ncbi:DUF1206 domain-containing protein [Herbiconiux sp. P15]|uniref:DUF1206 domain-containing protein n=1 Tax=Herbiconiux liukaitaii TaxID=3342799 RepID=UPI0035B8464B
MTSTAKGAVREASRNRIFHTLARSGFAVNGLLHILIGALAIGVAVRGGRDAAGSAAAVDADQTGALRQIADTPGGLVVLWIAVVCLVALALWQTAQVVIMNDRDLMKRWGKRISEGFKGLIYFVLGATALVFALGGTTSASDSARSMSTRLLDTPGGLFLLIAVGLAVFGTGVGFASIGIRRTFRKVVRVPDGPAGPPVMVLGIVGYVAKGIAFCLAGVLFVIAGLRSDPSDATGLDGALRALAHVPFGIVALVAIGVGLIAHGVFLVARTRLAKL